MILLIASIIAFNMAAFKINKKMTPSQVLQIWTFTIAFQMLFDLIVEFKHHHYWYFSPGVEWVGLLPRLFLIPPVNIIFLNGFLFQKAFLKKWFICFSLLRELSYMKWRLCFPNHGVSLTMAHGRYGIRLWLIHFFCCLSFYFINLCFY